VSNPVWLARSPQNHNDKSLAGAASNQVRWV